MNLSIEQNAAEFARITNRLPSAKVFFDRERWPIGQAPYPSIPRREHICVLCGASIPKGAKNVLRAGESMKPLYACTECSAKRPKPEPSLSRA